MKTLNAIFYFPYEWNRIRTVKIKNDFSKTLEKIYYGAETYLDIPEDTKSLRFQIDYYKAFLEVDHLPKESFAVVYFDTTSSLRAINPKRFKVKTFASESERTVFCDSLYADIQNTKPVKHINKTNFVLGVFISLLLILSPFYSQIQGTSSESVSLSFLIGIVSLVSLLIIYSEKDLSITQYKTRIYATVAALILSLFFIYSPTILISVTLLLLVYSIRSVVEMKRVSVG